MLYQFYVYNKVIQLCMYLFFLKFFSHLAYSRILSKVPCAIQQVLAGYLLIFIIIIYFIFGCDGCSLLHVGFLQLWQAGAPLWLQCMGSTVMVHGFRCPQACGIFLDQGSNPCSLHRKVDSLPLDHQGRPIVNFQFRSTIVSDFIGFFFYF